METVLGRENFNLAFVAELLDKERGMSEGGDEKDVTLLALTAVILFRAMRESLLNWVLVVAVSAAPSGKVAIPLLGAVETFVVAFIVV